MEVLRVGQEDEEREDEEDVRPDEDALERLGRRAEKRLERAFETGDHWPGHGFSPSAIWVACQRRSVDDPGDEPEDEIGLAEVAALEPLRPLHLADPERGRDADEHERAEEVDEEREPALPLEPGERRARGQAGSRSTT